MTAAGSAADLAERLAVAEARIERLAEILADVLGVAVNEPMSAEEVRLRRRVAELERGNRSGDAAETPPTGRHLRLVR